MIALKLGSQVRAALAALQFFELNDANTLKKVLTCLSFGNRVNLLIVVLRL